MRLFRVRAGERTFWVTAPVKYQVRSPLKNWLIGLEEVEVTAAVAFVRYDLEEVKEIQAEEAPEIVGYWFERDWAELGAIVYAAQWDGEPLELSRFLIDREKKRERARKEGVLRRRKQLKERGKRARANAQRRVRKKR